MYLLLAAKVGSVRIPRVELVLKVWRGHGEYLRLGTMWQGWKSPKRAQERTVIKVQPRCSKRPQHLEVAAP